MLDDISHIQLRRGMYIGEALNPRQLLSEVLDNAIDEVQAGFSPDLVVNVDTKKNKYSVRDYGRGIPHGKKRLDNGVEKEILEILITKSNSGGKFDNSSYNYSSGLNGLGLTITNALSNEIHLVSYRDGKAVEAIAHGSTDVEITYHKNVSEKNGTLVEFIPNPKMFHNKQIPLDFIRDRCKVASALGFRARLFIDGIEQNTAANMFDLIKEDDDKISTYVNIQPIEVTSESQEKMKVAIRYTSDTNDRYFGYTNLLSNYLGGTHVQELSKVVSKTWKEFIDNHKNVKLGVELHNSDYLVGLRAVCAVFISHPEFSSQTKEKLVVNRKYFEELMNLFKDKFYSYLDENILIAQQLIKRFEEYRVAQNNLLSRKEISSLIKVNSDDENNIRRRSVVSKLVECTSKKRQNTELFIVEGDSAKGPYMYTRNKELQAVLPLRGKILNITNRTVKEAVKNSEICDIANSIGCGIGPSCDASKSRYEKVIISADADPDGCLGPDTRIMTLDGTNPTIKELVDNKVESVEVLSVDENGILHPSIGRYPHVTKTVHEICVIELDDGNIIECTPDHKILMRNGTYKEAKDLTLTDSLMPANFEVNDRGYIEWINPSNSKKKLLHKIVAEEWLSDDIEKKRAEIAALHESTGSKERRFCVHHVDRDKKNNSLNNLQIMLWHEHNIEHQKDARDRITAYNKSEKHIDRVKELHKNGYYKSRGAYESIMNYNKSEKHRAYMRDIHNKDPKIQRNIRRGTCLIVGKTLIDAGYELTPQLFDSKGYDVSLIPMQLRFDSSYILKHFVRWEEYLEKSANYSRTLSCDDQYWNRVRENTAKGQLKKQQTALLTVGNYMLSNNIEVNETNFNECRKQFSKKYPKYDKILVFFDTFDHFITLAKNYNHKIKSIRFVEKETQVYDMSVDDYHNYVITNDNGTSGIVVHNCHINCLVLSVFINLFPDMVKQGRVYVSMPPLYCWGTNVNNYGWCNKVEDIPENVKNVHRFKGLGEMNTDQLEFFLVNPKTRNLMQIQYPSDINLFNKILGSSEGKNNLLKEIGIVEQGI